jgi:hypothetical protein
VSRRGTLPDFGPPLDEVAEAWKVDLLAAVAEAPEDTPVLLSGGVDSGTILAACLELGRRPTCYGFHLADQTPDEAAARRLAHDFGLTYRSAVIPFLPGPEWLIEEVRRTGCGIQFLEPLACDAMRQAALLVGHKELHRGPPGYGQKGIAVRAFPRFWMETGRYRRNAPLQVGGGIRALHERLLIEPTLNPGGRFRDVVEIYNRMAQEEREPSLL